MKIEDFAGKRPQFLPEDYLVGRLEGWGILEAAPRAALQDEERRIAAVEVKGGADAGD